MIYRISETVPAAWADFTLRARTGASMCAAQSSQLNVGRALQLDTEMPYRVSNVEAIQKRPCGK
jgi:hypothetical protein